MSFKDYSLKLKDADFWIGSLVRATHGHDSGRVYFVKALVDDGERLRFLLVNGVHRKWLQPKAKNPKQVRFLMKVLNLSEVARLCDTNPRSGEADALVRRLINAYESKERNQLG